MHILKMGVSQPECAAYVVSVFLLKHGVASIVSVFLLKHGVASIVSVFLYFR